MLASTPASVPFLSPCNAALLLLLDVVVKLETEQNACTASASSQTSSASSTVPTKGAPLLKMAKLILLREDDQSQFPNYRELSLRQLIDLIISTWRNGNAIRDALIVKIRSIDSPLIFHNTIHDAKLLLRMDSDVAREDQNNLIDPSTVAGLFIRRCLVAFDELDFLDQTKLLCAFMAYCNPYTSMRSTVPTTFVETLNENYVQRYVENAIVKLEDGSVQESNLSELNDSLENISIHMPEYAQIHYLRALNAGRQGDLEVAVQEALRYTDKGLDAKGNMYHWSAFTLAAIYHRFNMQHAALEFLGNCLTRARKLRDKTCVQLGLRLQHLIVNTSLTDDAGSRHYNEGISNVALLNQLFLLDNLQGHDNTHEQIYVRLLKGDTWSAIFNDKRYQNNIIAAKTHFWQCTGSSVLSSLYATSIYSLQGDSTSRDQFCELVSWLSKQAQEQGRIDLSMQVVKAGMNMLMLNSPEHTCLYTLLCIQALRIATYREEWKTCDYISYQMPQIRDNSYFNGTFEVQLLQARRFFLTEQYDNADKLLHKLLEKVHDSQAHITIDLLHIDVLLAANPIVRKVDALKRATVCYERTKDMPDKALYWLASSRLAAAYMHCGMATQALTCIEQVLPQVRSSVFVHIKAQILRIYADCLVIQLDEDNMRLSHATTALHEAIRCFAIIGDIAQMLEASVLLSSIYHALGDDNQRDNMEREYNAIRKRLIVKSSLLSSDMVELLRLQIK